jgi:hypothetical protein
MDEDCFTVVKTSYRNSELMLGSVFQEHFIEGESGGFKRMRTTQPFRLKYKRAEVCVRRVLLKLHIPSTK